MHSSMHSGSCHASGGMQRVRRTAGQGRQQAAPATHLHSSGLRLAKAARTWPGRPQELPGMRHTCVGRAGRRMAQRMQQRLRPLGSGNGSGRGGPALILGMLNHEAAPSNPFTCAPRTLCFFTSHCTTASSSSQPALGHAWRSAPLALASTPAGGPGTVPRQAWPVSGRRRRRLHTLPSAPAGPSPPPGAPSGSLAKR